MQSEDLSAPAATSADELKEDAAGAHAKADDFNLGRDGRAIVPLDGHRDTRHAGRQIAGSTNVGDADAEKFVQMHRKGFIKSLGFLSLPCLSATAHDSRAGRRLLPTYWETSSVEVAAA
jgi:hypothetical protein